MGIFDGILGGQSGLTHTTTTTNTNPAQQAGGWNNVHPSQLQNSILQQHNTILNNPNPRTWTQGAMTPWGEMMELKKEVEELRYILQRTVENYEELQSQHKALLDITEAGENR